MGQALNSEVWTENKHVVELLAYLIAMGMMKGGKDSTLGGADTEEKEGRRLRKSIWKGGRRTSKEDAVKAPGGVS